MFCSFPVFFLERTGWEILFGRVPEAPFSGFLEYFLQKIPKKRKFGLTCTGEKIIILERAKYTRMLWRAFMQVR